MGLLKNVFLTATFVVLATMATSAAVAVAIVVVAWNAAESAAGFMLWLAPPLAAVAGLFFSVLPLCVAAVTMPPALAVARALKLPRPAVDIVGGALAGALCAMAAAETLESLARAKGGAPPGVDMTLLLAGFALVGGGVLGYVRHAVLARKRQASPASQFAY